MLFARLTNSASKENSLLCQSWHWVMWGMEGARVLSVVGSAASRCTSPSGAGFLFEDLLICIFQELEL